MKKLLLLVLLVPSLAFGELMPPGCYVSDFVRTDPCWVPADNYTAWVHDGDRTFQTQYYGVAVETILYNWRNEKGLKEACQDLYNGLSADFAASDAKRVNEYNTLVSDYNALLAQKKAADSANLLLQAKITKLNKQIKKLKGKK